MSKPNGPFTGWLVRVGCLLCMLTRWECTQMLHVTGIAIATLSYVYMHVHVAMFHSFTYNLDKFNPPTFGASGVSTLMYFSSNNPTYNSVLRPSFRTETRRNMKENHVFVNCASWSRLGFSMGILLNFFRGPFQGAMLIFGDVCFFFYHLQQYLH